MYDLIQNRGCICCEDCAKHGTNKRNQITPCSDRYQCDTYVDYYNKAREAREAIKFAKKRRSETFRTHPKAFS